MWRKGASGGFESFPREGRLQADCNRGVTGPHALFHHPADQMLYIGDWASRDLGIYRPAEISVASERTAGASLVRPGPSQRRQLEVFFEPRYGLVLTNAVIASHESFVSVFRYPRCLPAVELLFKRNGKVLRGTTAIMSAGFIQHG